ncbi:hypothetical protein HYT58_01955 [Candidatus Woesearchaeota archaeon]|nr:hypothetical protein [Candidatus Woesearchaeota archaeon]
MMGYTYEDIIKKIIDEKGLKKEEVEVKVKEKLNKFSDLISRDGAAHIVANELGVKLFENIGERNLKINKIIPGMRSVNVAGKVTNVFGVREYKTEKHQGKVGNFLMGDETGIIKVVFWDTSHIKLLEEGEIKQDAIIRIKSGYVKEGLNGYKEIHLGNRGSVDLNPKDVKIEQVGYQVKDAGKKNIELLQANDFAMLCGTVVQVFEPRYFEICSECEKRVKLVGDKFNCDTHGTVNEKKIPVMNFVFDDGTDSIRVVAFRDAADKLLNGYSKENFEQTKNEIVGKQLRINGVVKKNDMFDRLEFNAKNIEEITPDELIKEFGRDL